MKRKAFKRYLIWTCRKCGRQWRDDISPEPGSAPRCDESELSICDDCLNRIGQRDDKIHLT